MGDAHRKNFDGWHPIKKSLELIPVTSVPYFAEREIWWCRLGCNVGYEQDGNTREFWRPVLVVKKYNAHLFMGIPLTSRIKPFPFYFDIGEVAGTPAMAILSQMRPLSSKRLINKADMLHRPVYIAMKKAASEYLFGG